jgi:predicted membrane GTPase involved in stress response
MHYRYPLEQIAASRQSRFQRGFARMAIYLLPSLEDVVYEPTTQGLRILAGDECALATPVDILRQIYGEELRVSGPRVRMVRDASGLKEPVMNVRVSVPASFAEATLEDAARRDVAVHEVDYQADRVVVRGQAPLRQLLGYQQTLAGVSSNTAEAWIWLSHYQRVPHPPGGEAA